MEKGAVKRSVKASIQDGMAWGIMSGFVDPYIVPFALFLKSGPMQIGLIRSFPLLMGAIGPVLAHKFETALGGRKKTIILMVAAQAGVVLLSVACAFMSPWAGLIVFTVLSLAYTFTQNASTPSWISLMSEYLPLSKRGYFLGFRSMLVGFVYMLAGVAACGILSLFKNNEAYGFALIFLSAGLFRVLSVIYLSRMHDPGYMPVPESGGFIDFLRSAGKSNMANFCLSSAILSFAIYLASPFLAVYLLRDLKMDYWRYLAIIMANPIISKLAMPRWGAVTDRHGSVATMRALVCLVPLILIMWSMFTDWKLLLMVEIYSGLVWSSSDRAIGNFVYDSAPPALRTKYSAYVMSLMFFAQFAGALSGGWLYEHAPLIWSNRFITVLLASSALSIAAAIPFFTIVRQTGKRSSVRAVLADMFLFKTA